MRKWSATAKSSIFFLCIAAWLCFLFSTSVEATYRNRLSLMPGLIGINSPQKHQYFELGGEYEHRLRRWIGIGFMGNYVLSNPRIKIVGAPELFWHPFEQNWFFSGAALFQTGATNKTKVGARIGTRLLFQFPLLRLAPFFDYDFINGGHQYLVGVALEYHTP